MFTGIVEETGLVESIRREAQTIEFVLSARVCAVDLKNGDSVAVNGCCLTVTEIRPGAEGDRKHLRFDLLEQTWRLTNLQFAKPGRLVNLERALRADGRVGGHFVSGHIDGMGRIDGFGQVGGNYRLEISAPHELMQYIVAKGSIAVDGVSLTVAEVGEKTFTVWVIPHTLKMTAMHYAKPGDSVNIETDMLAKYVEKLLGSRTG